MPVLTDRQEPEDFDKRGENPEEPNDYAIKYLFSFRRPKLELWRTGRTLLYSGAAGNLLGFFMLLATLDFQVTWGVVFYSLILVAVGALVAYRVWRYPQAGGAGWLAALPLVLFLLALLDGLVFKLIFKDAGLALFYLAGTLVMLVGALVYLSVTPAAKEN
jgi:hypothetical protein